MAKLSREDVLKLARLSRLQLSEEEIVEFQEEISAILGYVEQLQKADVGNLEPSNQVTGLANVMRGDEVKSYGYEPKALLKNVPVTEKDLIKTRRIL